MFSLLQSRRVRGSAGDPLPQPWKALESKEILFRRGEFGLIAAGPGAGKSAFILSYLLRSRVPSFYQSCDSNPFTQLTRSISVLTGRTLEESDKLVRGPGLRSVEPALGGIPIRFNFDPSPGFSELESTLASYEEVYGEFPSMIVIDNITNMRSGSEANNDDPFGGLEASCDYFHDLARTTQACVIGLHHVTGAYNDADKPIPLSGVKGQIGRVPEMILTLHKRLGDDFGNPDTLCVSAVKNRGAKADASGQDYAELKFIGEKMQIRDYEARE